MSLYIQNNFGVMALSYQHLHGTMLVNLNRLACELKLSHAEYHLMGVLIGYWNKKQGKAYPTIKLLAKVSRMSASTVASCIKKLTDSGLIIVIKDTKNRRQNYFINTARFLADESITDNTHAITAHNTPCGNSHEQTIRTKLLKNHQEISIIDSLNRTINPSKIKLKGALKLVKNNKIDLKQNDDAIKLINKKDPDILRLKKILTGWNYTGIEQTIEKYGVDKIKNLIDCVQKQNPQNPGAYLRTLLNETNKNPDRKISILKNAAEESLIKQMLNYQFWRHIPTGKIYKVKPDVGEHLLIKYNSADDSITIIDSGFKDNITTFQPASREEYISQNEESLTKKPVKSDIIKELVESGRIEEAETLSRLWRIS